MGRFASEKSSKSIDSRSALADAFQGTSRDELESRVREEFTRWSAVPVRDFVPIFVERALRGRLRASAI